MYLLTLFFLLTIMSSSLGADTHPRADSHPPTDTHPIIKAAQSIASTALSTFHALNDAEPHHVPGAPYSTIRHTRPWVYYRGTATLVPITILGLTPLPAARRLTLQRRGWRTGLLGWRLGALLGGAAGSQIDVTPQSTGRWAAEVEARRREQLDSEVNAFLQSGGAPGHEVLETDFVHVPVESGDGYFRIVVYADASARTPIASTAAFRVGSLSLSSAQPRGASVVTIAPELVLRAAGVAATTAAYASFYSAFPFVKLAQMLPFSSGWGNWAMRRMYSWGGGEEVVGNLKGRYRVDERKREAEESVYRTVPFGSAGVRTAYDLEEDAKKGRGGMAFQRK